MLMSQLPFMAMNLVISDDFVFKYVSFFIKNYSFEISHSNWLNQELRVEYKLDFLSSNSTPETFNMQLVPNPSTQNEAIADPFTNESDKVPPCAKVEINAPPKTSPAPVGSTTLLILTASQENFSFFE